MHKIHKITGPRRPVFFALRGIGRGLLALAGALSCAPLAWSQAMLLPTAELVIAGHKLTAEIAATEQSRSYGLMNRASMPQDHGMLFVFERAGGYCFWMKDTPLPLSIAFINDQGKIVNIAHMQPRTLDSHCPAAPVRFALEMNKGWFGERDIRDGALVEGLPPTGR